MRDDLYYRAFLDRDRLVHIVDADLATCEAVSEVFGREGFVTSFSLDAASFFASLDRWRPDAAIVNLEVGDDDGLSVLRRLKAMRRGMAVFAIADKPLVEKAVTAMKAGAADVLTKPLAMEHLVRGVRDAVRHNVHLGGVRRGRRRLEVHGFAQLTQRERDVLQLVADGRSNKEAGLVLGISPRTVEVHRARVMEKLGARNTADLMRIVLSG